MIHTFLALILILSPGLISTFEREGGKLNLEVINVDPDFSKHCLQAGLELRYRYTLQLCKRRSYWLDSCSPTYLLIQEAQYSPISESYSVSADRIGDITEPHIYSFRSRDEALERLAHIENFEITNLAPEASTLLQDPRRYVSSRVEVSCKGEYNKTLARISYILSLGLIDLVSYDSGWRDLHLNNQG